eukprot:TRINITY_DN30643_c0_g1_i1.p1 TRINITY_DN30643_c0_g1~~TRINITY_DN30643_c0_g1_i1.p1  ORF type:complete len:671 (+),score=138.20 TRINITY_DN30643_c0_g1_i1:40-2013(+)
MAEPKQQEEQETKKENEALVKGSLGFNPSHLIWVVFMTVVVWNVVMGKGSTSSRPDPKKTEGGPVKTVNNEKVLRSLLSHRSHALVELFVTNNGSLAPTDDCVRSKQFKFSRLSTATLTLTETIPVSVTSFLPNTSLYLHMLLRNMDTAFVQSVTTAPLVKYVRPPVKKRNLLDALHEEITSCEDDDETEDEATAEKSEECTHKSPPPQPWTPYYKSNVVFSVVTDFDAPIKRSTMPGLITDNLRVEEDWGLYHPLVLQNDFWIDRKDYTQINDSVETLPDLTVTIEGISLLQFSLYKTEEQYREMHGRDDTIKQLLKGDKLMLGLVVVASVLHSVFNILAFKNDVGFWRKQTSAKGQSLTTVYYRIAMQIVILLYLMDHESTSWVVTGNYAISIAVETWKAWKIYCIQKSTGVVEKDASVTADKQAATWLFYGMVPLLLLYAMYSFVYDEHKNLYSFVLSVLVRFIYWFGFAMMTPQLFVNYKLKSVAHLPTAALVYKALGTFTDDLFSMAIEMPTAHRISCLRDDVVFLVLMYQYRIYKVDVTRVNEFGQCELANLSSEELLDLRSRNKENPAGVRNIDIALRNLPDREQRSEPGSDYEDRVLDEVDSEPDSETSSERVEEEIEEDDESVPDENEESDQADEEDDFVKVEHGDTW